MQSDQDKSHKKLKISDDNEDSMISRGTEAIDASERDDMKENVPDNFQEPTTSSEIASTPGSNVPSSEGPTGELTVQMGQTLVEYESGVVEIRDGYAPNTAPITESPTIIVASTNYDGEPPSYCCTSSQSSHVIKAVVVDTSSHSDDSDSLCSDATDHSDSLSSDETDHSEESVPVSEEEQSDHSEESVRVSEEEQSDHSEESVPVSGEEQSDHQAEENATVSQQDILIGFDDGSTEKRSGYESESQSLEESPQWFAVQTHYDSGKSQREEDDEDEQDEV